MWVAVHEQPFEAGFIQIHSELVKSACVLAITFAIDVSDRTHEAEVAVRKVLQCSANPSKILVRQAFGLSQLYFFLLGSTKIFDATASGLLSSGQPYLLKEPAGTDRGRSRKR